MEATRTEYAARLASADIFDLARSTREAAIWRLSIEHGVGWCDAEIAWLRRARLELGESRSHRARLKPPNANKSSNAKKEHKHK